MNPDFVLESAERVLAPRVPGFRPRRTTVELVSLAAGSVLAAVCEAIQWNYQKGFEPPWVASIPVVAHLDPFILALLKDGGVIHIRWTGGPPLVTVAEYRPTSE